MNGIQKIIKNIGVTGLTQALSAILAFILQIYIARYLGVSEFGNYSFVISFTSLFMIFADIGISQLMIREIARFKGLTSKYVINATIMKIFLSFLSFLLVAIFINLLGYPQNLINIVYIFGIYMILSSFAQMLMAVFQAHEKMEYFSAILMAEKLILLPGGLIILFMGYGLMQLGYIYVLAGLIEILLGIFILIKKIGINNYFIDKKFIKSSFRESIPFGLNIFFASIFFQVDTVLLSIFKGSVAVGIYAAAYTPLLALGGILSNMFTFVAYPLMSKYHINSNDYLSVLTKNFSKYIIILGVPVAVICFVLADKIINLFYGIQYNQSVIVFQILSFFIPLRLISSLTGTLLTSVNKQNVRMWCVIFCGVFNFSINLILIPSFSFIGAAIATVVSELLLYSILLFFIARYQGSINLNQIYIKPIIAAFIMGFVLYNLKQINWIFGLCISFFIYFVVLFLIGTFSKEDKNIFKRIIGWKI